MAVFCRKKLNIPECLGEKLKRAREEKGLTLDDVSKITHIEKKYLIGIEEGNYTLLPKTNVHRQVYIKKYCQTIGVDYKEFLNKFKEETRYEKLHNPALNSNYHKSQLFTITIFLRNIFALTIILVFFAYIGFQIRGILVPPKLLVLNPVEGQNVNSLNILIQGETEKESRVTINGKEIMLNDKGQFESMVDLSEGLNTIIISVTKKHGKTTTVIRHVIAKNFSNN